MSLALIQPVTWMPVVHCDTCGQDMPADHQAHIETAPRSQRGADDTEKDNQ